MNREKLEEALAEHISYSFSRSQGPGGQNVNKVNTKVTARLNINNLTVLSEEEQEKVKKHLEKRLNQNNELIIQVQDTRFQSRNKKIAAQRILELVQSAFIVQRKRHISKPSRNAVESRLNHKRQQSQKKQQRRKLDW